MIFDLVVVALIFGASWWALFYVIDRITRGWDRVDSD
jgi:hypothetical protein